MDMDTSETPNGGAGLEKLGNQKEALKAFLTEISASDNASVDVEKLKSVLETVPGDKRVPLLGIVRDEEEDSFLHKAIQKNLRDAVKVVFECLSDVEKVKFVQQHLDKDKRSLFQYCIKKGKFEILDDILEPFFVDELDILFQIEDRWGQNIMHYLCTSMVSRDTCEKMLRLFPQREKFKYLCVRDEIGWTPVSYAMTQERSLLPALTFNMDNRQLAELCKIRDNKGDTLLIQTTRARHRHQVRMIMDMVPEEDLHGLLIACDSDGMNSPMIAIKFGDLEILKELFHFQSKTQVYEIMITADKNGHTLLHLAILSKNSSIAHYLLGNVDTRQHQDDVMNIEDKQNLVPFDHAGLVNDRLGMVALLNYCEPHRMIEFLLRFNALLRDRTTAPDVKSSPELRAVDEIIALERKHTEIKRELMEAKIEYEDVNWTVRSSAEVRIKRLEEENNKYKKEIEFIRYKHDKNDKDAKKETKYQRERLAELQEFYDKNVLKKDKAAADE